MTTLVAPSHTAVDAIPLSRRIAELMKEKGMYYSISAMAGRVGIGRETFRLMLKGGREIYTFELEKIAKDLKVSLARLLQEDIKEDAANLRLQFDSVRNIEAALDLALRLEAVALGISEKSKALNNVGRALYLLRRYDEAHEKWLAAYPLAKENAAKNGDSIILFYLTANLLLTHTLRGEFAEMHALIREIEPQFGVHPEISGSICYSLGEQADRNGDLEKAGEYFRKALDYFERTGNDLQVGKALHNVAHYEFRAGNLQASKERFEKALPLLQTDLYEPLLTVKDYCRTLLALGEKQTALHWIEDALQKLEGEDNRDLNVLRAKFLVLKSQTTDDPAHAVRVLKAENLPDAIRALAGDYLIHFYGERNDLSLVLTYYEDVRKLLLKRVEI